MKVRNKEFKIDEEFEVDDYFEFDSHVEYEFGKVVSISGNCFTVEYFNFAEILNKVRSNKPLTTRIWNLDNQRDLYMFRNFRFLRTKEEKNEVLNLIIKYQREERIPNLLKEVEFRLEDLKVFENEWLIK